MKTQTWTQKEAIELCKKIEAICPKYGCHVALTGGLLYKDGERKDLDILFYRIRQAKEIDLDGLWEALESIRLMQISGFGWCFKCEYLHDQNSPWGKNVDCFFPEEQGGEYNPDAVREAANEARQDQSVLRQLTDEPFV